MIRKLREDEIECRIGQVTEKGCTLLLYKTARVDRAILDETFTATGWQNDFKMIDKKMYGGIAVKSGNEWVWKWDCGTESNTEAEKGEASDCFKRAGFKWGIGVELYSAPFIFVKVETCKIEDKWKLKDKYISFSVKEISYDENKIKNLIIVDNNGNVVFSNKKNEKKIEPKTEPDSIDEYNNKIDAMLAKEQNQLTCSDCGEKLTRTVHDYSMNKFGKPLCMSCQKKYKKLA